MADNYIEVRDMVTRGDNGINKYCIIACDEDYPTYAVSYEDAIVKIGEINSSSMQRVMEVYNYQEDIEEQLRETRAWRI